MVESTKKVIFVVGPTASGKSAWALEQAEFYKGSIVNIDSVQFYKGLEVGSAAPTTSEKKRVPHYLYSFVEAPNEMTAAQFLLEFEKIKKSPDVKFPLFIVGGTGFYIQALEKGLFDIKPIPQEVRLKLESELAISGAEALYQELKAHDPETRIHVNDHYRLIRALEIIRVTGKTPSEMKLKSDFKNKNFDLSYVKVGFQFEKEYFKDRVYQRTLQMIQNGIITETQFFLNQHFRHWAPLSSVGFKEVVQYLEQNKTKDWLIENIVQSTMQLIKKQKTWFKRDASILWSEQEQQVKQFLQED